MQFKKIISYCLVYGLFFTLSLKTIANENIKVRGGEILSSHADFIGDHQAPLETSWSFWYPYSFLNVANQAASLTGLDIQLMDILSRIMHRNIQYKELNWSNTLLALKNGSLDFASGASYSAERSQYYYYTKPYRYEEDALFLLRENASKYSFKTVPEFLNYMRKSNFRLGIKTAMITSDQRINDFMMDQTQSIHMVQTKDDSENIQKLLNHDIDGFITDRIEGASLVIKHGAGKKIYENSLSLKKSPIYIILSKKTQTLTTVLEFNRAIDILLKSKLYNNILSWYLYPVILLQSVESEWFRIIDFLGTLFFAISGVLIANSLNATLLAAFVYALLPSLCGGILRDILFNQRPVEALSTPMYMITVCIVVLIGLVMSKVYYFIKTEHIFPFYYKFFKQFYHHVKIILACCDALGLAAFTVTGVLISLKARVDPLWMWGPFFAFLTGAMGTLLRDILIKRKRLADIKGQLYSEIAIFWGLFLSISLTLNISDIQPEEIKKYVIITIVGAFSTRMLVYFTKVHNVYFKM